MRHSERYQLERFIQNNIVEMTDEITAELKLGHEEDEPW